MSSDPADDRFGLPAGSVVPSADIWDDDDDWEPGHDDTYVMAPDGTWVSATSVADVDYTGDDPDAVAAALEADPTYDGRTDEAAASRVSKWGKSNLAGLGLSAIGFGIQKVLEPQNPVEIEMQVDDNSGDPDGPINVVLDQDHPENSVATVRPWLFGKSSGTKP